MTTITLNRNETTSIPFTITDANNGLAVKRVTWSVAKKAGGDRLLRKVGGLPGSTPDITILTQAAGQITGLINILLADYASLTNDTYFSTLWIDDGGSVERCVTAGGVDTLSITGNVARSA